MSKQKPAYLIASSFMPEGHGSLDAYGHAVHPLMEKWGGELLVAGETNQFMEHYEGEWKENARFTLFRFPSLSTAAPYTQHLLVFPVPRTGFPCSPRKFPVRPNKFPVPWRREFETETP